MDDRVVQAAADPVPMRVLSRYGTIRGVPVVIQVARSEADMRQNLRDLLFVLAVGLPRRCRRCRFRRVLAGTTCALSSRADDRACAG